MQLDGARQKIKKQTQPAGRDALSMRQMRALIEQKYAKLAVRLQKPLQARHLPGQGFAQHCAGLNLGIVGLQNDSWLAT